MKNKENRSWSEQVTIVEVARMGGRARAKKLTKARRHEIAMKAGLANKERLKDRARSQRIHPAKPSRLVRLFRPQSVDFQSRIHTHRKN